MKPRAGYNIGVDSYAEGIERHYLGPLAGARLKATIAVQDDGGLAHKAVMIHGANVVFRLTGNLENPDTNMTPYEACVMHNQAILDALPDEFSNHEFRSKVWLCNSCEPDKNLAEWYAHFSYASAQWLMERGFRYAAFGWATGCPHVGVDGEPDDWLGPNMRQFLSFASAYNENVAIHLHEYSLGDIDRGYDHNTGKGWWVGRFWFLHEACKKIGITPPRLFITECGWNAYNAPELEQAVEDIKWLDKQVYGKHDNIDGFAMWTLARGWNEERVQPTIRPVGEWLVDEYAGNIPPIPPSPGFIDLSQFMLGQPGMGHTLQLAFPNNQGQEFHETRYLEHCQDLTAALYQKGSNAEMIYYDDHAMYRGLDTSPEDIPGVGEVFYLQSTYGKYGAYWINRFVKVGDVYERAPTVTWHRFDNCYQLYPPAAVSDSIRVAALYDGYTFRNEHNEPVYTTHRRCIELEWMLGGVVEEKYLYVEGIGLGQWVNRYGWKSYMTEEYVKPSSPWPGIPVCYPQGANWSDVSIFQIPWHTYPQIPDGVTMYGQRDDRWKNVKLGFSDYTLGAKGCLVTCLAMLANVTPVEMNDALKAVDGFAVDDYGQKSLIIWDRVPEAMPSLSWHGSKVWEKIPADMGKVWAEIDSEKISIIRVDFYPGTPQCDHHFVLGYGRTGVEDMAIIDPWTGTVTGLLERYGDDHGSGLSRWIFGLYRIRRVQVVPPVYGPGVYRVLSNVLNIRSAPSLYGMIVGKMPKSWTVYVESVIDDSWAQCGNNYCAIKLGNVEYMRREV